MTYATERTKSGRQPLAIIDLILDTCANTFGVAPCTATAAAGGECYNTRQTCADTQNYIKTTTTYRFCERRFEPPPGVSMFPALREWNLAPSKITPGKGIGQRASIRLTFSDFPHHDRGIDPYVATRLYTPEDQGTFFGKLFARNTHYSGRLIQLRQGYVSEDGFDLDNDFQVRTYIIDKVTGPDPNGVVSITGKDILMLLDDKRSRAPIASEVTLTSAMDTSQTSLNMSDTTGFASSGYLRVGKEIMAYSGGGAFSSAFSSAYGEPATALTVTRAQWGTEAKTHKIGDTVQPCVVYEGDNPVDVVRDLINLYAPFSALEYVDWGEDQTFTADASTDELTIAGHGFSENTEVYVESTGTLPAGLVTQTKYWIAVVDANTVQLKSERGGTAVDITSAGSGTHTIKYAWDYERDTWLFGKQVSAIISAPVGLNKLISELTEEYGFDIWWDEVAQRIRLRALAPARFGPQVIQPTDLVADTPHAKQLPEDRLSQVWVYFDRIDHSEGGNKPENHSQIYVAADLVKEGPDLYNEPRIKEIFSRWMATGANAAAGATRTLRRFAEIPTEIKFRMDSGATLPEIGDEVTLFSRAIQDVDGSNKEFDCQIMSAEEVEPGHTWEFTALLSAFSNGRYCFIGPNSLNDYTAESESNTLRYGFLADGADPLMSNGDEPYRII